jgi:membrane-associated phospholipid phosphatase
LEANLKAILNQPSGLGDQPLRIVSVKEEVCMPTAVLSTVSGVARAQQHVVSAAAIWLCVIALPTPARASDAVMAWNDTAQQLIVVPALSPVQQTRAMAIVQVAMHDAVNAITRQYHRYRATDPPPAGASPEAAAIGAAYAALKGLFGDSDFLAMTYAASIDAHDVSPADPGLAFGQSVADAIVALRQQDGAASAQYAYTAPGAGTPGVWTPISSAPSAQALLPGWGDVTPWVLRSGSQFRPDAPPALDSERYANDFNEVFAIGAVSSTTRTGEQTQIALFWRASPTALWNPILRTAIESRRMDLSARARAFALFYLASADASVACWEAKYFYNYWRPQPAIVAGDLDGNPATPGEPTWVPRIPTAPHPEYPSGHTANSGAMAFVLRSLFGDAPGYVIEATSSQNVGFVREWTTFSEGVREVIDARVYSGIHFRTADEAGARLGRQVAQFVLTHSLRPVK